tara:strand:- start:2292 stop:2969 length:678 start_codon:yes stop_codon:yes gene_type:complete
MKNILVIGNSSVISKKVCLLGKKKKFKVFSTYFKKKINKGIEFNLDLSDEESIKKFIKKIEFLKFDIVIITSAVLVGKGPEKYTRNEIQKVLKTNVIGISILISKIINCFKNNSTLILISSSSYMNGGYDVIYSISKSLLSTLGKSFAKNFGNKFKTICLLPGLIDGSNQLKKLSKSRINYHKKNTPVKKFLKAEDVARIIFDLHNKHWLSANGAEIKLDGGYKG